MSEEILFEFPTITFDTKYGKVTLHEKDEFVFNADDGSFNHVLQDTTSVAFVDENGYLYHKYNGYWDESTLNKLKDYIPKNKNILEIGGHCGTSTLFYIKQIDDTKQYYVFEPQEKMYKLLVHNLEQNNLEKKVKHYNAACFCFDGHINMHNIDMDGHSSELANSSNRNQEITFLEQNDKMINYAGRSIGTRGELVKCYKIDNLELDNIGFIHCDAQGSENFLFHGAKELIKKYKPVILYENKDMYGTYLYNLIRDNYPEYIEESEFDIKNYCMNELKYNTYLDGFGTMNTLLLP